VLTAATIPDGTLVEVLKAVWLKPAITHRHCVPLWAVGKRATYVT
jgi:hypothetical protein